MACLRMLLVLLVALTAVTPSHGYENTIIISGLLETNDTQSYQPDGASSAIVANNQHLGIPRRRGAGAVPLGGGKAMFTGGTDGKDIAVGSCPHDIVFVLDASGSITLDIFKNYVLKFVTDLVERAGVSFSNTNIGVVVFADKVEQTIQLTQYTSTSRLVEAINALKYTRGETDITGGLQSAFGMVEASHRTVSPSIVLITDGKNNVGGDPVPVANKFCQAHPGAPIISIAIPGDADHKELLGISCNNDAHVFTMTNIGGLFAIATKVLSISNTPCQAVRNGGVYQDTYIFDAAFGQSTAKSSMLQERFAHGIVVKNGVVTVCGGATRIDAAINLCEQYANGQWSPITSLPTKLTALALTSTPNGILAIGGDTGAPGTSSSRDVYEYDSTSNAWAHRQAMPVGLRGFGAVRCPNSDLTLVCGGFRTALNNAPEKNCYVYDPSGSGRWTVVAPLTRRRAFFSLVIFVRNGVETVYAVGGTDGAGATGAVEKITTCPHGGGTPMSTDLAQRVEQGATVAVV